MAQSPGRMRACPGGLRRIRGFWARHGKRFGQVMKHGCLFPELALTLWEHSRAQKTSFRRVL